MAEKSDGSFDLIGVGRAMKAIPAKSWERLVNTACDTFASVVAPITESAAGVGRLIQAKFDKLVDVEKVLAAEAVATAAKKAKASGRKTQPPRPQILIQVVEQTSQEADTGIRELWSNLLAQEMLTHGVHPEVGRVLARISSDDAQLLTQIVQSRPSKFGAIFIESVRVALQLTRLSGLFGSSPTTFNHAHLRNLGLIAFEDGKWDVTAFGEGFLKSVSDPEVSDMTSEPA